MARTKTTKRTMPGGLPYLKSLLGFVLFGCLLLASLPAFVVFVIGPHELEEQQHAAWLDVLNQFSAYGQMFGLAAGIFSGLALIGVIYAIVLQRQELQYQRKELRLTRRNIETTAVANTIIARISALVRLVDLPLSEEEQKRLEKELQDDLNLAKDEKDEIKKAVAESTLQKYHWLTGRRLRDKVEYLLELSLLERRLAKMDEETANTFEREIWDRLEREQKVLEGVMDVVYGRVKPEDSKYKHLAKFTMQVHDDLQKNAGVPLKEEPDKPDSPSNK